jgi:hypothetical protein
MLGMRRAERWIIDAFVTVRKEVVLKPRLGIEHYPNKRDRNDILMQTLFSLLGCSRVCAHGYPG